MKLNQMFVWPLFVYGLKGLKPKNKGHTNFYECCDLTKNISNGTRMHTLLFYIEDVFCFMISFLNLTAVFNENNFYHPI